MGNDRHLRLLIATDGSPHANAALATALDFPWPAATRASGIAARQAPPQVRRSILLSALDRSTEAIASRARRTLARRWPDAEVVVLEAAAVDAILSEVRSPSRGSGTRRREARNVGFSTDEATRRLQSHGLNELQAFERTSAWHSSAAQSKNVLILILLAATVVSGVLEHALESAGMR